MNNQNRGVVIGLIAFAVVAVLAFAAIFLTGGDDDPAVPIDAVQETGPVEVTGEPLPTYPAVDGYLAPTESDPAVGQTPPTLTGEDFGGNPVTIDTGDGRAKVVVFVAHTCPHCQKEVPVLQQWVDDGNLPDDVDLWAVSTGVNPAGNNYPPSEWLAREGWTEGILLDNADMHAAASWGLTAYPYMVFVDADGTVVQRATGEVPADQFGELVAQISSS